jgi:hypothetical protein
LSASQKFGAVQVWVTFQASPVALQVSTVAAPVLLVPQRLLVAKQVSQAPFE